MNRPRHISISIDVDTLARDLTSGNYFELLSKRIKTSYKLVLPKIIEYLDKLEIKATFFMVANDVLENPSIAREIVARGHELASHSRTHNKLLSNLNKAELKSEITDSKKIIEDIIGKKVEGFRAPGYCLSNNIIDVLEESGYVYDSSLNTSPPYNFLKLAIKKLCRNYGRENLKEEKISFIHYPYAFRPSIMDYNVPGFENEKRSLIEIPIFLMDKTLLPLTSSIFQPMGKMLAHTILRLGISNYTFIPIELHDFEFASRDDYLKVNGGYRMLSFMRHFGAFSNSSFEIIDDIILTLKENVKYKTEFITLRRSLHLFLENVICDE